MFVLGPAYLFILQHRLPIGAPRAGWQDWFSAMATNAAIALIIVSPILGPERFLELVLTSQTRGVSRQSQVPSTNVSGPTSHIQGDDDERNRRVGAMALNQSCQPARGAPIGRRCCRMNR